MNVLTGKRYPSVMYAAVQNGMAYTTLVDRVKRGRDGWRYVEEEE